MQHFDPLSLESFLAVAETKSFRAAGERVARTQSTVSGHIAKLEQQLGTRLFERTTRSVVTTPDGERLVRDARRLLAIQAEIAGRAQMGALQGAVRLGVSDDLASGGGLARIAADFVRFQPGVSLTVNVGNSFDLADHLDRRQLDLVLLKRSSPPYRGRLLWEEPIAWACTQDFDFDVEELPLAVFPERCVYRDAMSAALDAAGRRWRIAYETPSVQGLFAAIGEGFVVGAMRASILPPKLAMRETALGSLPLGSVRVLLAQHIHPSPAVVEFARLLEGGDWRR